LTVIDRQTDRHTDIQNTVKLHLNSVQVKKCIKIAGEIKP